MFNISKYNFKYAAAAAKQNMTVGGLRVW